jgi:hypothetical protein
MVIWQWQVMKKKDWKFNKEKSDLLENRIIYSINQDIL